MVAVSETSIRETVDNNLQSPRRCFALCNNNKTSIALVLTIWAPLPPSLSALIPRSGSAFSGLSWAGRGFTCYPTAKEEMLSGKSRF
ncbi:hypothetical protein FF1_032816 [Malus domestica]